MDYDNLRAELQSLNHEAEVAKARWDDALAEADEAEQLWKDLDRSAKAIRTLLRGAGEPSEKEAVPDPTPDRP